MPAIREPPKHHEIRTRPRARTKNQKQRANYWRIAAMNGWTPERKARQARLIRNWRPWEHSTGPKTEAGKERSKKNARTVHGLHSKQWKAVMSALREHE